MNSENFPHNTPYTECIDDDPEFIPAIHLSLELPEKTFSLSDFGYANYEVAVPTDVAATSVFRILSTEGVDALYSVCKQLEQFATSNPRVARNVRGGVYRSRFLRDLALSVDVAEHMSQILKTPLTPHGMPHQLAHLNFQPLTPGENVDKWHWDTLQVDYVMFVTNPNEVVGGEFQYFNGTRDEMVDLHRSKKPVPAERVIAPTIPSAGYAVLMQGDQVVHQARGIESGERITLVNGYTYASPVANDYSALDQLVQADPENTVFAEYARHMALRCQHTLNTIIRKPDYSSNAKIQATKLRLARQELDDAIVKLESHEKAAMRHFGD